MLCDIIVFQLTTLCKWLPRKKALIMHSRHYKSWHTKMFIKYICLKKFDFCCLNAVFVLTHHRVFLSNFLSSQVNTIGTGGSLWMKKKKYIYIHKIIIIIIIIIKKRHKTKTGMDPQIFISILKISIFRIIFDRKGIHLFTTYQSASLFNLQRKGTRPKVSRCRANKLAYNTNICHLPLLTLRKKANLFSSSLSVAKLPPVTKTFSLAMLRTMVKHKASPSSFIAAFNSAK